MPENPINQAENMDLSEDQYYDMMEMWYEFLSHQEID